MMIVIIAIMTFKDAIQDLLQSLTCTANCLLYVLSSVQGTTVWKLRATHLALITCNMPLTTWNNGTAQS